MKKMILSLLVVSALAGSIIKATEEPTGAATGIVGSKKFDDKATKDLFAAVKAGNLVAVKAALDHGAEVNGKSD
jgi:hypothetical protein